MVLYIHVLEGFSKPYILSCIIINVSM